MKKIFVLISLSITVYFGDCQTLNSDSCIKNLVKLQNSINERNTDKHLIDQFWTCYEDRLENNVELSEFRNEVLFALLEHHTAITLLSLNAQNEHLVCNVLADIEYPVNDLINLYKIYYLVNITRDKEIKYKELIMSKLEHAIEKGRIITD